MGALATLLLVSLLTPRSAEAAHRTCQATIASEFASGLERAGGALRACVLRRGEGCTDPRTAMPAAARLARKVLARCTPVDIRAAAYPPPFDPPTLAARLVDATVGNAAALVQRSLDAVGESVPRTCLATLGAVSTRLAVRTFRAESACALAGEACDGAAVARRTGAVEAQARRAAVQRCPTAGLAEGAIEGLVARARSQMTCALAQALPASGTCAPSGPEALVDLWRLASSRPPGTLVAQVSSYDRAGGNADLGIGPDTASLLATLGLPAVELDYSYLYRDGDRYVVFDEVGPGVVWRIWMTGLDGLFTSRLGGDVAFELDGEARPRVHVTRDALFAGTTAPFVTPLAGDSAVSSGGFYAVVPIPFARRLRITTSTVPNWLQITFSRLPPDQAVTSFDPLGDTRRVAALLASAGDPATSVAPSAIDEVEPSVAPATTQTLWSRSGSGAIVRLELLAPAGADVPTGLRLRATFDAAAMPQVDAPLDDLFGASLGPGARSIAFGRDGDRYYCYFPMPFRRAARLELRNDSSAPFGGWTLRVGRVDALPPGPLTHFHATAAAVHLEPDGRDDVLLDAAGAGHVVGVVLTAGCGGTGRCQLPNLPGLDGAHLEGDERIALDGSRWPQLHGTGLEDFFSGGFYFIRGAFRLPTHGNPAQVPGTSPRRPGLNLRSAYRLFLGDAIPFRNAIRLAIEHGPTNDVPAEFSSLVFYYAQEEGTLVESDRVTIGDAASETAHAFVAEGRTDVALTSAFRGDQSDVPVVATGLTARVTRFRVTVEEANRGVRLRRLADIGGGRQAARVVVDGAFAGAWQTSEVNPTLRWAEPEFEVPAALSAGRRTLAVELDARDSPTPWTAFEYEAFSHR
jgi:hypothetical protein